MEFEYIVYGRPDQSEPHTRRWIVRNGDTVGAYTLHCRGDGSAYGAGRDVHKLATADDIAAWEAKQKLDDPYADGVDEKIAYARCVDLCEFHFNKPCICDGSSLVEIVFDDERAFRIAEMMAR